MTSSITEIHYQAILSSIEVIDTYFQRNNVQTGVFHPIAVTSIKKSSGWSFESKKPENSLKDIVSTMIGKPIFIKEFDTDTAPAIQGVCVEKTESATIFVKKGLNFCWRRFIVAKELNHLLMNTVNSELRCVDIDQVKDVLSYASTGFRGTPAAVSEGVAYLGAMEMLIPKAYLENGLAQPNIAEKIKCPSQVIEMRLMESVDNVFQLVYSDRKVDNLRIKSLFKKAGL